MRQLLIAAIAVLALCGVAVAQLLNEQEYKERLERLQQQQQWIEQEHPPRYEQLKRRLNDQADALRAHRALMDKAKSK